MCHLIEGKQNHISFTKYKLKFYTCLQDNVPSIALDIGCSVGRSTFELAKRFDQVVGVDYSHAFIDASNKLKMYGKLDYTVSTEGSLVSQHTAEVDPDIVSFFFCHLHTCRGAKRYGKVGLKLGLVNLQEVVFQQLDSTLSYQIKHHIKQLSATEIG